MSAPQSGISEADKTAIRAKIDEYVRAALAGDADGWGRTLAEDVVVMPPNMAPIQGRVAAVNWLRGFPKLTSFTSSVGEIAGFGDMALVRGSYDYAATLDDGTSVSERGSFVEIHQRGDGTWPYSRLIWHSDVPAAPLVES
jgi:ketosteroid isomerase-like protein